MSFHRFLLDIDSSLPFFPLLSSSRIELFATRIWNVDTSYYNHCYSHLAAWWRVADFSVHLDYHLSDHVSASPILAFGSCNCSTNKKKRIKFYDIVIRNAFAISILFKKLIGAHFTAIYSNNSQIIAPMLLLLIIIIHWFRYFRHFTFIPSKMFSQLL